MGTLKLSFGNGIDYDLGIMESFQERFSKSVMTTPIPTMGEDSTFAIESGSGIVVSMEFSRVTPDDGVTTGSDPTKWTNGHWYKKVRELIDRWQAKTNGCTLTYTPGDDNPYLPARVYNGYIKTMNHTFKPGDPTVIYTTLEFHVGTMTVNTKRSDVSPTSVSGYEITMSNGDQSEWYALMVGEKNCIESYTIEGGMEQPFESITMSIPKNRLSSVAPGLVDNIVAGGSKVILNAVGRSTMTVVKCKLSNKTYKITAYCDAEAIKGYTLNVDASYTPWYWIKYILCSGEYGMAFTDEGDSPTLEYSFDDMTGKTNVISFKKGQNIWFILQVCALYLGCKIFFAGGKAYCVDYRKVKGVTNTSTPNAIFSCSTLDLYTEIESNPLYGRLVGSVTLGDEGVDTVINEQVIGCTDENGKSVTYDYKLPDQKTFRSGTRIDIPELIQGGDYKQAEILAKNLVSYRAEPQQSITFTLREMQGKGSTLEWAPYFDPSSYAKKIVSSADEVVITNMSNDPENKVPMIQKLLLSQYERNYPEGTSKYTFGIISNIDLAVSTSQILTSRKG